MTIGDLLGNATAETPLLVLIAGGLLSVAAFVGRRAAASMQRQGRRIGAVENALKLERTRRRQLEQCLRELNVPLPYWPDDPPGLYRPTRLAPPLEDDGDEPYTTEAARPPVPPFSPDERERLARHRR